MGAGFDSIIFDCDGVLVDITESYDRAIDSTCRHLLRELAGIESVQVGGGIIDSFKRSGGFNDEVDLAYAVILATYAAEKLGRDHAQFLGEAAARADSTGVRSVVSYLESVCDISGMLSSLGSLEDRHENPVYSVFDQVFYGPELYEKLFGRRSRFPGEGMITRDKVILSEPLLRELQGTFGERMAVVTGRGLESITYSLGGMLEYFDLDSSAFLEDEPREMAKPNPASLVRAVRSMGSESCIYVGDSMEDLMMARAAAREGCRVEFCAVTGTSTSPGARRRLFSEAGVRLVLGSIDELPKALNPARRGADSPG